jgi:hypothetical protein
MLCVLSGIAYAAAEYPKTPVFTGTVNIVLANSNGIVVITDSNQTWLGTNGEPFTYTLPGQKLFRIDDTTVCTIAGFGSAPLPDFPEFDSSAAGVLDRYAIELRTKGGMHSFHEKLTSLRFLFDFQLTGIGNMRPPPKQIGEYRFELILAGYDTDGTARIGKIVLGTRLQNGMFSPVVEQLTETTVGRELAHETAGIGGPDVENILSHPSVWGEKPEIARYAASKTSDHGSSLTTADMESLAKSLARQSALDNRRTYLVERKPLEFGLPFVFRTFWPIGGRNQIAVLEKGSIPKIEQPTFEERKVNMTPFAMFIKVSSKVTGPTDSPMIGVGPGTIGLYLKSGFFGGLIHLDNAYYFEDDFSNATLYYDGGVLGFDPSNRVLDCILTLGPHVDKHSHAVEQLIAGFHWKTVQ